MDTSSEPPSMRHADTNGRGPIKRRRPALSLIECRRRKVKCDREKPRGPCRRKTSSSTCTYRPHPRDQWSNSPISRGHEKEEREKGIPNPHRKVPSQIPSSSNPYGAEAFSSKGPPSLSPTRDDEEVFLDSRKKVRLPT
ncbi:hypothetical protein CC80DRAFT_26792 [Byssothecium circinans]|uniref:Zn(2)-C6 fungal-type domain-containing protein n=1 Tax=Byssothecium circinans TaxID=147558 RepID=A0A6A5U331_9PLEO|nr:hypothetical protein CC80DRAFT_26792 [Byssothecium circinans]